MARKNGKRTWLSSTAIVLIIIFVLTSVAGYLRYGTDALIDAWLKYAIGASFTGILILIIGMIFKKQIKSVLKKVVK